MKKFKKSSKQRKKIAERKQKKLSKQTIMSIGIVVLMVASVIGFMWSGDDGQSLEYNNYVFIDKGLFWETEINGQKISFSSFPSEVEDINLSEEMVNVIKTTKMVYVTSDPDDEFKDGIGRAQFNMKNIFEQNLGIYFVYSFTKNNTFGKPIITCENSTATVPVMLFEKSNKTGISFDNDCIIFEAFNSNDFNVLGDRLLFGVLDIIE
ncbi:hypothetical protein KY339_02265 [Candidatus Woesearchaeota archaeon]|nr:hypothetical protein [Candidatus Woesearchaeota archaeon]